MKPGPEGYGILVAALQGLFFLGIGSLIYTVLAVAIHRRWGGRALSAFWFGSAGLLSIVAVVRTSGGYVLHGGKPIDRYWGTVVVSFVVLATAGAALRVAQVGRPSPQPSVARQTFAGCAGMLVAGGALLLGFLVMDVRRLFRP